MSSFDFLQSVVPDWPDSAKACVATLFENQGKLAADQAALLCDQFECNVGELLPRLLPIAKALSLSSVSGFKVGCVAMGNQPDAQGIPDIFLGANIELPNAPLTTAIHAEQCVTAIARYHGQLLTSVALEVTPCGFCRQFLYEFSENQILPIQIGSDMTDLNTLLPDAFGPSDLNEQKHDSIQPQENLAAIDEENEAEVARIAKTQAYVPYSGIATSCLVNWKEQQAVGFAVENAAFNPSLSAFSVALCVARMSDSAFQLADIETASIDTESINHRFEAQLLLNYCNPAAKLSRFP